MGHGDALVATARLAHFFGADVRAVSPASADVAELAAAGIAVVTAAAAVPFFSVDGRGTSMPASGLDDSVTLRMPLMRMFCGMSIWPVIVPESWSGMVNGKPAANASCAVSACRP